MRRFRTNIIAIALATFLLVAASSAQQTSTATVPNLIRYSGTLKDAQGAVPSGTPLGVTFAIYKQQDGGVPVWQEIQNVTPDASGQYSVVLGSTTATGLPDDLFLQQEQRWLGVQVQGEAEQARVLLVSVPYAFKAHEAETLGGLPPSAFVKATPTDASGGTSTETGTAAKAGTASKARGTTTSAKPTCFSLGGGGTLPQVAMWDGPCDLVSSGIYQPGFPGGPVGILKPAPIAALDVNGAINVSPTSDNNTGNYQILESPVLSIGWPSKLTDVANQNLYAGVLAGAQGFAQGSNGNTGTSNTFVGYGAAFHNQQGSGNTAVGVAAGYRNIKGNNNTYVGVDAAFGLFSKAANNNNTIMGYQAGFKNTGSNDSFYGYQAGYANFADGNSFFGFSAGSANTSGNSNTFLGNSAGIANTTGDDNTFSGYQAGLKNSTGSDNIFYGYRAGVNNVTGSENIYIGHQGPTPNETNTIRIGNYLDTTYAAQFQVFIEPILPHITNGQPLVSIDSVTGQLGIQGSSSSRRFKEQIADMGESSSKLLQLRPVTFFYKPQYDDGSRRLQYGLIAEEVAEVYPEMVAYDKDGQPSTVLYQFLAPMLLNELQKQHVIVTALQDVIKGQQEQIQSLQERNEEFQQRLSRLESLIAKK